MSQVMESCPYLGRTVRLELQAFTQTEFRDDANNYHVHDHPTLDWVYCGQHGFLCDQCKEDHASFRLDRELVAYRDRTRSIVLGICVIFVYLSTVQIISKLWQ